MPRLSGSERRKTWEDEREDKMRIAEIFEVGGSGRDHRHGDNCGSGNYGRYGSNCSCRMRYEQGTSRSHNYSSGGSYNGGGSYSSGMSYGSGNGMGGY